MNIVYSDSEIPLHNGRSIFLCGPTPRKRGIVSWRKEAISILQEDNIFDTIFVPERKDWSTLKDYTQQTEWEYEALNKASLIMFWIPRELPDMPALTTNVEFGLHIKENKLLVYGRPNEAVHCRYLDWLYKKFRNKTPCFSLKQTIKLSTYEILKKHLSE